MHFITHYIDVAAAANWSFVQRKQHMGRASMMRLSVRTRVALQLQDACVDPGILKEDAFQQASRLVDITSRSAA